MEKPLICLRCHRCKVTRGRGLCHGCFYEPGVREQYEPIGRYGRAGADGDYEMTEEELEAIISEQMENLPEWWFNDRPKRSPLNRPRFTAPVRATGGRE